MSGNDAYAQTIPAQMMSQENDAYSKTAPVKSRATAYSTNIPESMITQPERKSQDHNAYAQTIPKEMMSVPQHDAYSSNIPSTAMQQPYTSNIPTNAFTRPNLKISGSYSKMSPIKSKPKKQFAMPSSVPFQKGYNVDKILAEHKEYVCFICNKVARDVVAPNCDCTVFCNSCVRKYLVKEGNICPICKKKASFDHRKRDKARIQLLPTKENSSKDEMIKNLPMTYSCPCCRIDISADGPWQEVMLRHAMKDPKTHMQFFLDEIWEQFQITQTISFESLEKSGNRGDHCGIVPKPNEVKVQKQPPKQPPTQPRPSSQPTIEHHPAYSAVTRTEAQNILKGKIGAYLVRPRVSGGGSGPPTSYAISVHLDNASKMSNFLITQVDGNWILDKEQQIKSKSLVGVIGHAVKNFRLPPGYTAQPYSQIVQRD